MPKENDSDLNSKSGEKMRAVKKVSSPRKCGSAYGATYCMLPQRRLRYEARVYVTRLVSRVNL